MNYEINHDLHIHSLLSTCSDDPEQTTENILKYAQNNGFCDICLTDHFWDSRVAGASEWYAVQNYEHVKKALPLPQGEGVRFHFGAETDLSKNLTLGISKEAMESFELIIIPTTHLHMTGFTIDECDNPVPMRAKRYVQRLEAVLNMDLPFHKIGIAHLTTSLIAREHFEDHLNLLDSIGEETFRRLFKRAAQLKTGIELNFRVNRYTETELQSILRPYRIAKEEGCLFYFGSDSHHPKDFDGKKENFTEIASRLCLCESDRFNPFKVKTEDKI